MLHRVEIYLFKATRREKGVARELSRSHEAIDCDGSDQSLVKIEIFMEFTPNDLSFYLSRVRALKSAP